ncbi:heparin lyase I family protein [Saccharopolyspora sp. 5N102]|uniref:heparin lyase I family protein n=1 Tax=Saccharopolyspora sp. 5N102 TaxID=3375155 RepID=UPI00378796C1
MRKLLRAGTALAAVLGLAFTAADELRVPEPAPAVAADPQVQAPVWAAETDRGTSVFEGIETKPGSVEVVADPQGEHGDVYRLHTSGVPEGSERVRVESRGHKTPDGGRLRFTEGDTYYIGWRSMWDPLPAKTGEWVALWQLKDYGSGAATPPLSLRARGDVLDLEYCDPDMKTTQLWKIPLPRDSWNSFVVGVHVSSDPGKGWVKFWHNGEEQVLNGQNQFPAATLRADFVTDKWGVYRSDGIAGEATAYLADAKVGRSYADVAG